MGDWKLIYYHDPARSARYELFNLAADLGEKTNLAGEKPELREALARQLAAHLRAVEASMPIVKSTGKPVSLPE